MNKQNYEITLLQEGQDLITIPMEDVREFSLSDFEKEVRWDAENGEFITRDVPRTVFMVLKEKRGDEKYWRGLEHQTTTQIFISKTGNSFLSGESYFVPYLEHTGGDYGRNIYQTIVDSDKFLAICWSKNKTVLDMIKPQWMGSYSGAHELLNARYGRKD